MKKFCIIFLLSIIISLTAVGLSGGLGETQTQNAEYIRIHIRANSNDSVDQAVKYLVKDEIVEYLTSVVAECTSKEKARKSVENSLSGIERVANAVLKSQGFDYGASAAVKTESFPTRVYGEFVLEEGEYLALVINLGEGEGNNWWCVIYPPLCFSGNTKTEVIYKSKIAEIIQNWKKNRG